ncbi:flagellar hook-basal body complex protein [Terrilactibacillus sp. BCM23-1]|uniref:Flagellar hook-basal body complex protein n=1 Tax=Terrilactibacillus tamarindi TaxID=2599694 RepID=A0A6N8CSV6_9BACI|nr:flagellar hook-basal body protein [Terrilactibacillus tamarindi]MTT32143.1 flagellar hook-basal body complex protein [Terrilactibacillus tamarindi]
MQRSMITSSVTMGQIQKQLDMIGNNLANASTTGYKSKNATFTELLEQQMDNINPKEDKAPRLTPDGIRSGTGAKIDDIKTNMTQGGIQSTDRDLDLALTSPDQMFEIGVSNGTGGRVTQYTRDGAFYLSTNDQNPSQVNFVTRNGQAILDSNGNPISLPSGSKSIEVSSNGEVTAIMPNDTRQTVGQIGIVTVNRPELLESRGDNLYGLPNMQALGLTAADVLTQTPLADRAVKSHALENSNVDMTKEMTDLVTLERSYQFNARALTMSDQMSGLVNNLIR